MPHDATPGSGTPLVACAGARFSKTCADVIAGLALTRRFDSYRFVMEEWIEGDSSGIGLLWVVDDTVRVSDLARWLAWRVPLLVPEQSLELKNFCVTARCGLYYEGVTDAEACLHLLLTDDALRESLGRNGQAYATLCELIG